MHIATSLQALLHFVSDVYKKCAMYVATMSLDFNGCFYARAHEKNYDMTQYSYKTEVGLALHRVLNEALCGDKT